MTRANLSTTLLCSLALFFVSARISARLCKGKGRKSASVTKLRSLLTWAVSLGRVSTAPSAQGGRETTSLVPQKERKTEREGAEHGPLLAVLKKGAERERQKSRDRRRLP